MIAIVTCWYGHTELRADYIAAVLAGYRGGDEVIIVNNGGCPGMPFFIVSPGENLGFARGSNYGLAVASADAVVFLNNDVALGKRGWLDEIRQALEPGVLVGPLRGDYHARVDRQPMPYIDGWCLAGMREDLLALGGFDEELQEPAYYSDNLLCLEARAAGMTLRNVDVPLVHKLNVTAGPSSSPSVQAAATANRERYVMRARELLASVTH